MGSFRGRLYERPPQPQRPTRFHSTAGRMTRVEIAQPDDAAEEEQQHHQQQLPPADGGESVEEEGVASWPPPSSFRVYFLPVLID